MSDIDLKQQESHFAFGRNWAEYSEKIAQAEIEEAERGMQRLLGGQRLDGQRFLDIGSGSGLHSLAALRLGAREVVAVDLDPDSVETTLSVLSRHSSGENWRTEQVSVFDLSAERLGTFDVVYSWGVLHHTGDMARAVRCAAAMVGEGGRFVFALYRRVWMDWFWRIEKRWYAQASPGVQEKARACYSALFRFGLLCTGRKMDDYINGYRGNRGMNFWHDVHDWMGGWPYESISPGEVEELMRSLGFERILEFSLKGRIFGKHSGVFGSGCDEFAYQRISISRR